MRRNQTARSSVASRVRTSTGGESGPPRDLRNLLSASSARRGGDALLRAGLGAPHGEAANQSKGLDIKSTGPAQDCPAARMKRRPARSTRAHSRKFISKRV